MRPWPDALTTAATAARRQHVVLATLASRPRDRWLGWNRCAHLLTPVARPCTTAARGRRCRLVEVRHVRPAVVAAAHVLSGEPHHVGDRRGCAHADGPPARVAQGLLRGPTSAASPSRARSRRPGVAPDQVDYVIMGQVLQAGAGQIPARQAAAKAGIPMTVPALTINKVCLSGHRRDRAGRPADPRRRVRGRRRRRPGVDDQRAAPAARSPARATSTAT